MLHLPAPNPLQVGTLGVDEVNIRHLGYLRTLLQSLFDCLSRLGAVFAITAPSSKPPHAISEATSRILCHGLDRAVKVE